MKETRTSGAGANSFFSKLSRGLMLPIAMLPIAGLFLGVGAGFGNVVDQVIPDNATLNAQVSFIFDVMSSIGDVIFANLPTLFALGVAIAFAEDAGVAVFSALIGWIVFNATQSTMIWEVNDLDGNLVSYNILWWKEVPTSVVSTNVGITSMQTSVFGGITIGLFVAYLYNKFHTFQMPKVLGFFSGTRFVPIITFLTVPLWGFFFLMIWPGIGILLNEFGSALAGMPAGIDSFIFGVVERSLIPFGLHHAFYTPLWYTSAGGELLGVTGTIGEDGNVYESLAQGNQNIWFAFQTYGINYNIIEGTLSHSIIGTNGWEIDSIENYNGIDMWVIPNIGSQSNYDYFLLTEGVNPGAYMQGKFPFMLFGLPAAGAAMIMAAKKENREIAMSVIGAAAITSFLTGITEPIEFTFLFLAPVLYYGFHIWMAGLSFMLMDVLGAHIGMTFSGGIFDFVLFGILPDATGFGTNSFWVIPVGILFAPIYYFVFYYYIIKFDVKTPGRDDGEVALVSKADYKEAKQAKKSAKGSDRTERVLELEKNLGGLENLETIDACITRLRLTVKDRSALNDDALKAMGAAGIVGSGKSVQVIFGAEADIFKTELKDLQKSRK